MRISHKASASLTLASICVLTQAWPLFLLEKRNPEPHPAPKPLPAPEPQSYSVVPVDGGPSTQAATKTITNVSTQVQTMVATVTVEGSERITTIVTTRYIPVTVTAAETRTMTVEPSVTSVPYDNGQWHTTYYYRSTASDVWVPNAAPTPSPWVNVAPTPASSVSMITAAPQHPSATVVSPAAPATTNWATAYGTWHNSPQDGSWWGKRLFEKPAAALAKLL